MRAHRQADVTDHQLHDQVYGGHYNINHSTEACEKLNEWFKCTKNIDKTLEREEDGMQDHVSRVNGDVGVVLLQF